MIGFLAAQDISFDKAPRNEIVSNFIERTEGYNSVNEDVLIIEPNNFNSIDSFTRPNPQPELMDIQEYFFDTSEKKLLDIISSDKHYLKKEGINLPNDKVIDNTLQLMYLLASKNIFPTNIATSVEEGICLAFNKRKERLYFEIYNDGDAGYIIEDTLKKIILKNADIHLSEASDLIETFYK